MKKKKTSILKRFAPYMGNKKSYLTWAVILSGISSVLTVLPYVFIWIIVRFLIADSQGFSMNVILPYAIAASVTAILGLTLYFGSLVLSHLAAFRVETALQKISLRKILQMPLGYFDDMQTGKIRKIINTGASSTHGFLAHQLPDLSGTIVTPFTLLIMILMVNWKIGLISLIPLVMSMFTFSTMMNESAKKRMKDYYSSLEAMSAESVEYVRGIPVVKTFNQTVFSFKRFYDSILKYKDQVMGFTLGMRESMSFATVIIQCVAFFLVPASILFYSSETIGLAIVDFIFYIMVIPTFAGTIMKSMYFLNNSQVAIQSLDRIEDILTYPQLSYNENKEITDYTLEFKDVTFAYKDADENAVEGISFKVNKGESVALIGASGGGKTTIARLAARFWDVDSGAVFIGGENIKNISKENLMENISFVFQNTRLLEMSLRENITLGREHVSEQDILNAVSLSQSKEIIDALPDGLETVIGTKGTYLSGGEQQRISLARAILKDAPIVILDEATAFADPENEYLIQKALAQLSKGKTSLMIAHRLTSVQGVDRILVVDKGQIIEEGNHEALMAQKGAYYDMYTEYIDAIDWNIKSVKGRAV